MWAVLHEIHARAPVKGDGWRRSHIAWVYAAWSAQTLRSRVLGFRRADCVQSQQSAQLSGRRPAATASTAPRAPTATTRLSRASQYDDAGVADCEANASATGCPCLGSGTSALRLLEPGRRRLPRRRSASTKWSACQTLPSFETCNGSMTIAMASPTKACRAHVAAATPNAWAAGAQPVQFVATGNRGCDCRGELTLRSEPSTACLFRCRIRTRARSPRSAFDAEEVARYRTRGAIRSAWPSIAGATCRVLVPRCSDRPA
jgi:hypothetical protein